MSERGRLDDVGSRGGSPSRQASLRPWRRRLTTGDDVRRTQDHLAQATVGALADSAASLQRSQVVENEVHRPVTSRVDWVADESLNPFDNVGFEMHGVSLIITNDDPLSDPLIMPSASRVPKRGRTSPIATRRRVRRERTRRRPVPPPGRARQGRFWSAGNQAGGPREPIW
jgi:hypothetical protein